MVEISAHFHAVCTGTFMLAGEQPDSISVIFRWENLLISNRTEIFICHPPNPEVLN